MAAASATLSPPTYTASVAMASRQSSRRKASNVHYITGLNSFGGLKAQNNAVTLGLPVCTEQSFGNIVNSLKAPSQGKGSSGGGGLSSTCSAIAEIFRIAAIMNGL